MRRVIRESLLAAACAVTLLAAASPARADVQLFTRVGAIWVTDPAFDLFSERDAIPNLLLGAGWEGEGPLAFEVAYGLAGAYATSFGIYDSQLMLHQFQGAALLRLPFTSRLRGLGRAAVGYELTTVDVGLEESSSGVPGAPTATQLEDRASGLVLEGTLGAELRLPISASDDPWSTSLGLTLEAGYGWRPLALSFDQARVERHEGALRAGPVDLGELDLSGPILRCGLSLTF